MRYPLKGRNPESGYLTIPALFKNLINVLNMSKSIKVNLLPIRTVMFIKRQIKCLSLKKSKDLEAWLKVWQDVQKLPATYEDKMEWDVFQSMKEIPFTFEDSHHLFNEGMYKGLGRKVMWLGACLANNALERQREEVRHRENILNLMFKTLNPHESDELSKEDETAVKIINGGFSDMMDAMLKY